MSLLTEAARAELVTAYTGPTRHYHNMHHIETLLALAQQHAGAISDPAAVEAAIWFHDAVYDARRSDNEEQSALLAIRYLAGSIPPARLDTIATMIRATARHQVPNGLDASAARDCALMLDMDLAILGSPPEVFSAYEQGVRREYGWVPSLLWRPGRRKVLQSFLDRPSIYVSPQFQAGHEASARRNLHHALAAL